MIIKIESGFLPKLQQHLFFLGRELKNISNDCRIIILLFAFSISTSAQSINNKTERSYDGDWLFLGLENERVTAIAVDWADANIIYAGSSSDFSSGTVGGIFKTTNEGTTWDTLIRGVTVRDLDIHPTNPQIIYATLGLNVLTQAGIIKTADAGYTWVQADSGILITWEEGPSVLEIDPQHPDTLYTGTAGFYGGKPYKSTNGGESWFRIDPDTSWMWMPTLCGDSIFVYGDPMEDGITAIAIEPININNVYMGTAFNGYLFKSSDGGINWIATCLPQVGIVNSIEVNPLSTEIIYCGTWGYGFFISTNGGFSWENVNTGLPDTSQVEEIELNYFQNNLNIFIVANFSDSGGVYQRVNNSSWEKIGINDGRVGAIKLSNTKLYAGQGGIYVKDILTSVNEKKQRPLSVKLYPNHPNPFNPRTVISYQLTLISKVKIAVYDLLGKEIAVLINEVKPAGEYQIEFNAEKYGLSSGVYFYQLTTDEYVDTKKMVLIK